ncbi:hypothetical protein B0E41_09005 [Hydrogenophaga sp. A37]|nr:hypothetical protein B0E41_09005 [Hydrogenophaga sp. A37]
MEQGQRFKAMTSSLGFSAADVANFLQVSPRTVQLWISGRVRIPYMAFKLLRLQLRYELPGEAWAGWHLSAGRLYTPEGHELNPHDFSWWSLLVRKAALFSELYQRLQARERPDRARWVRSAHAPERDASRAAGAERSAGGLVPSKTSRQRLSVARVKTKADQRVAVISPVVQDRPTPPRNPYQHDEEVISPCGPIPCASKTNSPTPAKLTPSPSASVSMPWLPSPWTPTYTVTPALAKSSANQFKPPAQPRPNPPARPQASSSLQALSASISGIQTRATGATSVSPTPGHTVTLTGNHPQASKSRLKTPSPLQMMCQSLRSRPLKTPIGQPTNARIVHGLKPATSIDLPGRVVRCGGRS